MALALAAMAILGTAAGLVTVAVLAMWLRSAAIIVVAIVAAASGKQQHPLTHSVLDTWKTLTWRTCHFFSGSQAGVAQDADAVDSISSQDAPAAELKRRKDETLAAKRAPSVPATRLQERWKRLRIPHPFSGCLGTRVNLRAAPPTPTADDECRTSTAASSAHAVQAAPGIFNPFFYDWTAGTCFKVELNEIEALSPQKQPTGPVTLANGVGLQVTHGAGGSDLSLVIAPCGADGETPTSCLLKGVKGRETAVVTETEHLCLYFTNGTKELRSNQAGAGLWFHSWWNKGEVTASRADHPLASAVLTATCVPMARLAAIFPVVLRFRVLRADALKAPEEVRLYCYYESGRVRILQVLMQIVPSSTDPSKS